jgi:hypothetical protein
MVSKKLLGLAVAAAFSSQAFAQVNLDATTPTKPVFAKQTFQTGDKTTVGGVDYYTVVNAANLLDIQSKVGVGMNTNQKLFVRVDLTNALFGSAPTLTAVGPATITGATIAQGGADSSYVIFEVTNDASSNAQDAAVTVAAADYKLNSNFAGTAVTFTVYETLTSAVNNGTALYTKSLANVITVGSGLKQVFTPGAAVADVETGFKKFTGNALTAAAGQISSTVDGTTYSQAGTATVAADIYTAGEVKITGDFGLTGATYALRQNSDCTGGTTALTIAADKKSATTGAAMAANEFLCVTVDGNTVIPETTFNGEVTYTAIATPAFAPASFSGKVGEIVRNGTSIHIPYLTTFADYAQRLVLVNRGSSDVAYSVSFTPETGVTATAGAAANGTLKAKSTTVIPVTSLVTLSGATRTAATVAIVSASANIDAATTQVNLADKATDTVKLK